MVIQGVNYLSDFEAKKAIITAAAKLEAKGAMPAGDGSISVRVGPNAVWITLAGSDKSALTQDMMIRVDMNGKPMASATPKPLPEDLPIHLKLYQENKDVQCVIHSYPLCAALLGMKAQSLEPGDFVPAVRRLGRVKCLPTAQTQEQALAISLLCKTDHAVVLRGDGCFTWGKNPADASAFIAALDYYYSVLAHSTHSESGECARCQGSAKRCTSCQDCVTPEQPSVPEAGGHTPQLSGVTGLIRPGGALPPLPPVPESPVPSFPPAAVPAAEAVSQPSAAVDVPREEVMAEVIRRALASLG